MQYQAGYEFDIGNVYTYVGLDQGSSGARDHPGLGFRLYGHSMVLDPEKEKKNV